MTIQDQVQADIIDKVSEYFKTNNQGYIDVSMRVGKIKITLEWLHQIHQNYDRCLITYPNNKIKDSWLTDIDKWGLKLPDIQFVNFSSLHKFKDDIFDFFIIDEFHEASDNERDYCHQIMTNDKNTKTLGLSGTVSKYTRQDWGLKEIAKYSQEAAIKDEIISSYHITVHKVKLDIVVKTANSKGKLLTEKQKYDNYSFVINKMKKEGKAVMHLVLMRNRLATASLGKLKYLKSLLTKSQDKRMLIFCGLSNVADSLGIPSYHSKSKNDDNLKAFQAGNFNHLALVESGKIGITYPALDGIILLNATYNAENTTQAVSRATMLDYKEKVAEIHILVLNEEPELKKIKESLSMLDKNKIKYI